jgi:hypothetical protein
MTAAGTSVVPDWDRGTDAELSLSRVSPHPNVGIWARCKNPLYDLNDESQT